jgi:predicted CXXCH cytochrome family protein
MFDEGTVHQPVAEGKCLTCHTPHGGPFDHLSSMGEPEMCTGCHDFSRPPLAGSHEGFEVAGSKCTACHNPHSSTGEHLLNVVSHEPFADNDCESCHEDGGSAAEAFEADMCLMCHDDKESGTGHQHAGGGVDCIDCHSPHTSRFAGLLHNPSRLCQRCHSDVLEVKTAAGAEVTLHKPLADGLCLDCHKMHDPPAEGYLVSGQETLCANCHDSIKARASHANQHDPFKKGKCSSCHATHAAGELHMLKKDEQRLCKTCHRISTEEMSQAHGDIALSGENCTTCHDPHSTPKAGTALIYANRHSPYEDGDCAACHADDGSVGGGVEVCLDCHDPEDFPAVHAAGRTGADMNRVEVCLDCHSPHAGHDNMFRRKSDLETCVQCHDRKEFARTNVHAAIDEGCATCHDLHKNNFSELSLTPVNDLCIGCHEEAMSHAHPIGSEHKDPRTGAPMTCVSCHEAHSSDFDYMLSFDHQRDLCIQCHAAGTMRAR